MTTRTTAVPATIEIKSFTTELQPHRPQQRHFCRQTTQGSILGSTTSVEQGRILSTFHPQLHRKNIPFFSMETEGITVYHLTQRQLKHHHHQGLEHADDLGNLQQNIDQLRGL